MQFMVRGRAQGKTIELLKWLKEKGPEDQEEEIRVIVTCNKEESMRLLRKAREEGMHVESWQFVCADEFRSGHMWRGIKHRDKIVLGLDDANVILQRMFGWEVKFVTATGESV